MLATDRTVDVLVNVRNATNLMSSIGIFGLRGLNSLNFTPRLSLKTRSIAAICAKRAALENNNEKPGNIRIIQIGEREMGDILLRVQKVLVDTNREHRFPRYTFDFVDPDVNITQVVVSASVSSHMFTNNQ